MSTELLPRILTAAIAERNTLASDITIDEEKLRSIEAKLETDPTDKNLGEFARKMDDGLESDRKRMAKLDARIIKLSAELDPTQRDAHFATLESKKASVPTRMVKHAARVDTLGAQLESELRANVKAGAEDSKHVISAIT